MRMYVCLPFICMHINPLCVYTIMYLCTFIHMYVCSYVCFRLHCEYTYVHLCIYCEQVAFKCVSCVLRPAL